MRDLLVATLPFETTLGERTIQQLVDGPGPVPFVRDADTYAALADVAAHAGVLVVNAGGLHEAELLRRRQRRTTRRSSARSTAADVVELARPVPHPDAPAAAALAAKAARRSRERASSSTWGASSPPTGPCCGGPPRRPRGDARMVRERGQQRREAAARRPARGRPRRRAAGPLRHGAAARPTLPTVPQTGLLCTAVIDLVEARPPVGSVRC